MIYKDKRELKSITSTDPCTICWEIMDTNACQLKCHHIYHRICILQWINNGHITCPLCRSYI